MKSTYSLLILLLALMNVASYAQQKEKPNPWIFMAEKVLPADLNRQIVPQQYKTLSLNVPQMKSLLEEAPLWQTPEAAEKNVLLTLPMPDGSFEVFRIAYAPVMHPELAAQYPMIRSYAGYGIDDPTAYLRCDFTPRGFHGYIRSAGRSDVFIDPYGSNSDEFYISYYKKDFFKETDWGCTFDEVNDKKSQKPVDLLAKAGDCKLRTYALALACTGEYASFHGGTVLGALAAMNTTMTRVNGVFEIDASIHMDIIPNNNLLVFLDPATDPYTNDDGGTMLDENQATCDNIIGNANYDIGHVFSTGGGGVAYLGCVCNNSIKAGGVTGSGSPVGDPFDIDYVAHEMGHQYGANHTQNNSCNRNAATAMEPGSASTIMGYAGICSPNVQLNSDAYFHAISLQEMANVVTNTSCATITTINSAPTANAGLDYYIPRSTSFVMTGTASDPNNTGLTFCWEQIDNQVATMPPVSTNTGGPTFRSLSPVSSPSRYFPNLSDIVNNQSPTWEVLPSVARVLNFRLTVRDNHPGGGCTEEDDAVVNVVGTAGPFLVTAPNTALSWPANSQQTVTWDVASTTAAPISCTNVDILLSLDGGFTYPITLATATPNDGTHQVIIPNNQTSTARVMVRGSGNIFFDISNVNFTIAAPVNGFTLDVSPDAQSVCASAGTVSYAVTIGATGNFNGNVNLTVTGVPTGATAGFSVNPVQASGNSQLNITGLNNVAAGTYSLTVTGSGSPGTQSETVTLTVLESSPAAPVLQIPANGATGVSQTPVLSWAAVSGASSYELQVATDPAFANLVVDASGIATVSYSVTSPLTGNVLHYWRVRVVTSCGVSAYSGVFSFTTTSITCNTFNSTNVPVVISASGTPTVTSTLSIAPNGSISDINVKNLSISHTYISDLEVKLKSPANSEITLISMPCDFHDNILTNLDDEATNPNGSWPCPLTNNGNYQPLQALSAFDGENVNGTWTLTIQDFFNQDGGALNAWGLEVCYTNPPPATLSAPTVTQPGCAVNTGTIVVNANPAAAVQYSINGGNTYQSSATFSGLAPGNYNIKARLISNPAYQMTYSGNPVTINPVPVAPAVSAPTLTQPTCAVPTGTIVVNATGSSALEYSINGGVDYQSSATFPGLSPGTYSIIARLASSPTCTTAYSSNPVTINAAPALPTVTAPSLTQPTCAVPTGTIAVNATGSSTLEYSINGGTSYQSSATFSGLSPGNYNILVRLASSPACSTAYSGNPVTINAAPPAPAVTAPTLTQPTCAVPTGTIAVNASGNGTLEYSINGGSTYQASSVFSDLAPGTYNIRVRLQSAPSCVGVYPSAVVLDPATGCCALTLAVDDNPIPSGTYQAAEAVTSTGVVASGFNVVFKAGASVELLPSFEVVAGGLFEVVMQGCVQGQ